MKHCFSAKEICCLLFLLIWMAGFPMDVSAFEPGNPSISVTGGKIFGSEVDEADPKGEVEETYSGVSLEIPVQINRQSNFVLSFGGERVSYDWDNPGNLDFSRGHEPWDELFFAGAGVKYMYNWGRDFSALAGLNISAAWEEDTEDAYSYGGHLGGVWRTDSGVKWILGMGIFRRPEDTLFFPMVGFSWAGEGRPGTHHPGWSVKIGAPETEIRYSFNEILDVYCNMEMDFSIYRLDEKSKVSPSGLLEMTDFRSGLFVDIRPMKPLMVSLGATCLFGREWEIQDQNGEKIRDVDIDNAFGAKVSLKWTF